MQETPLELWLHIQFPLCGERDGDSLCAPAYSCTEASPHRSLHLGADLEADLSRAAWKQTEARVDHHGQWKSHREPLPSITVVRLFLCANDAGCGWLGPADAGFVTQTGAPGCLSNRPSGHLNRLPSLEKRSDMRMRRMVIRGNSSTISACIIYDAHCELFSMWEWWIAVVDQPSNVSYF